MSLPATKPIRPRPPSPPVAVPRTALGPLLLSLLLSLATTACGGGRDRDRPPQPPAAAAPVFSLLGEPLSGGPLGQMSCSQAVGQWFDRVDANHDGGISLDELRADARAQFARMDLDHDGAITADELSSYRAPFLFRDQPRRPQGGGGPGGGPGGPPGREHHRNGENASPTHALPSGSADPVMSADTNLDFKVSLAEFLTQTDATFARLDKVRAGRLGRAEIEAESCKALPGQMPPPEGT